MGNEERNPPPVSIDEGAEGGKEPEKPIEGSAEEGKKPEKPIEGSAEEEKEPEKPIEGSAEEGKEPEKPIELKKERWLGKAISFMKGGWLGKVISFKKQRWPKKILIPLGAGGVILLLAGLFLVFQLIWADKGEDVGELEQSLHELRFPLSSFLVPISSGDQKDRFVWIRIVLQLSEGGTEAIRSDLSHLRSTVFNVIERKGVEEFKDFSRMNKLKREIQSALNKRLEGVDVQEVFFVGLLIL